MVPGLSRQAWARATWGAWARRCAAQEHQSLYVLGKNISSCAYDALPDTVPQALRDLATSMLQPQPQSRPTIHQLCELCRLHATGAL